MICHDRQCGNNEHIPRQVEQNHPSSCYSRATPNPFIGSSELCLALSPFRYQQGGTGIIAAPRDVEPCVLFHLPGWMALRYILFPGPSVLPRYIHTISYHTSSTTSLPPRVRLLFPSSSLAPSVQRTRSLPPKPSCHHPQAVPPRSLVLSEREGRLRGGWMAGWQCLSCMARTMLGVAGTPREVLHFWIGLGV